MPEDPTPTADHPDETPTGVPLPPTVAHHAREGAGTVVAGRYKLLECVGEGGMGAVWSAQQTAPVKRLVAVKLIKAGIDSKGVLARFEAERQALAVMDHPNIAKILDGGVADSGSPFFVMELVKGVPITQYCDERRLTPAQRLELFVPVCEAIQHAHQKGVIHRDIKPSNVLVALQDGRPVPKVIDFGIAKATGAALTDLTLNTGVGGIVGTPQYMSPEQASLTGLDIDTRSDVYSLGVLLYELLAGSPPFKRQDLERAGLLEILRVVRDEEPPKPSTKLSSSDACASLSASRGTEPKALAGLLRSELDWVVMKALEKDRTRRYDTPTSFAADVRRYLSGEAVHAHPPSVAYKLRKFLRKNRGPVAAASLVAVALVAGVVGTSVGQFRAERARTLAETRREQAESAEALAETRLGEAEVATALAERRRGEAVAMRERAMETLRATAGEDVEKLIGSRKELGPNERAYLEAIIRRWEDFARASGDTPEGRAVAGEGAYQVARLWAKLGEREAASAGYRRAITIRERLAADFPDVTGHRNDLATSRNSLGFMFKEFGKRPEAEAEYRAALVIREKLAADFPDVPVHRNDLATSRNSLGVFLSEQGKSDEAEAELRAGVAVAQKLAADFPTVPDYRSNLASQRNNLGGLLNTWGKRPEAEAEAEFRAALAIRERLAADFPDVPVHRHNLAATHNNLGVMFKTRGKQPEAEAEYRAALAIREKLAADFPAVPEYRSELANSRNSLGILLKTRGKQPEAEAEVRAALAIREKLAIDFPAVPKYRVSLGGSCCNFGTILMQDGKHAESLRWFDKAVAALTAVVQQHPKDASARTFLHNSYLNRGIAYHGLKRHVEAIADWTRVIELDPEKVNLAVWSNRINARVRAGQYAEAVAEVAEVAELSKSEAWDAGQWYDFACAYAVASGKLAGKREEYAARAVELLRKAVAKGYKDSGHVAGDGDLDPLRGRADFRKLVAELEAKHPRPPELAPPPRPAK